MNIDLSTRYLGLELANPLVPSASPLSRSLDTARRLEDAGAAAIVMHSLFEEELQHEEEAVRRFLYEQEIGHAEAFGFRPVPSSFQLASERYLEQLSALKAALDIPVIASLNGVTLSGWLEHGRLLEEAGADALELNVYYVAADAEESGAEVEQRYIDLLRELRARVQIPITLKLGPQFSSLLNFVKRLEEAGADGVALFNRFYQPDINLDTLQPAPTLSLSTPAEVLMRVRWIAMLHGRVGLSLAATGGVHGAAEALKLLLAGADVVHLCSTLLAHGPEQLGLILDELRDWLERREYASVDELKGSLSEQRVPDAAAYARANYLQVLDTYTQSVGVR